MFDMTYTAGLNTCDEICINVMSFIFSVRNNLIFILLSSLKKFPLLLTKLDNKKLKALTVPLDHISMAWVL